MAGTFTTSMARNIFFGGTIFFLLVFLALTFQNEQIIPHFIKAWIKSQPTGTPGRRQMPNFNLTDQQLDELVAFFKYVSEINTANWPPNIEG